MWKMLSAHQGWHRFFNCLFNLQVFPKKPQVFQKEKPADFSKTFFAFYERFEVITHSK
jgi:hypothetical protein